LIRSFLKVLNYFRDGEITGYEGEPLHFASKDKQVTVNSGSFQVPRTDLLHIITYKLYKVTHKGCDFRDDSTEFD